MKKIKKSTGVAIAFLIYVSVTAAYLLPRNTEVSLTEKSNLTVAGFLMSSSCFFGLCSAKRNRCANAAKRRTIYSLKKSKFMKKLALAICLLLAVSFSCTGAI